MITTKQIKEIYKKWFDRDIEESEAQEILDRTLLNSKTVLSKLPGYSEDKFNFYLNKSVLFLSPFTISKELYEREKKLIAQGKELPKEVVELASAVGFCIVAEKHFQTRWSITLSDSPDIALVAPDLAHWEKSKTPSLLLEVLQAPQEVSNTPLSKSSNIFTFIKKQKFKKRYGKEVGLLLNVRKNNLTPEDWRDLAILIRSAKKNPYKYIFATNEPTESNTQDLILIFPGFWIKSVNMNI